VITVIPGVESARNLVDVAIAAGIAGQELDGLEG
jgi:hypothetical protein